jgi:hypothetical protein
LPPFTWSGSRTARTVSVLGDAGLVRAHMLGDLAVATAEFAAAMKLQGEPFVSHRGSQYARHRLDLGDCAIARALTDRGLDVASLSNWNDEVVLFHALLARIDLADGVDATPHVDEMRVWTARRSPVGRSTWRRILTASTHGARPTPPRSGRGVVRQPRARARAPRVHAGAGRAQAPRAPGRPETEKWLAMTAV